MFVTRNKFNVYAYLPVGNMKSFLIKLKINQQLGSVVGGMKSGQRAHRYV